MHGSKSSSGECRETRKLSGVRANDSPHLTEMDGVSENSCSEGVQNKILRNDMGTVITFATFDILHIGHLNLLRRAKQLGKTLVVGICTDAATQRKKGKLPVNSEDHRREIVQAIKYVDHAFVASKSKREHIVEWNSDILVMGSDHDGAYDWLNDTCQVLYLPRTERISTSEIIEKIAQSLQE